ncbi:MAG TPA: protocatechuate 3,4-dioxygenase subunit alpha [Terracidiphilus sp.]|nr:protocatechuate 3,4-dioxygenase subunit alpha [Terracidiphilus sp.]
MKENSPFIPDGSQTVGPFFSIGLQYMRDRAPTTEVAAPGIIEISGRVLDADLSPVSDAMLEFWCPQFSAGPHDFPAGFHRVATGDNGQFSVVVRKPEPSPYPGGRRQAPHLLVLVFCRGLLRNLVTRIYFDGEPANDADPVLLSLHPERRPTLVAQRVAGRDNAYEWDIVLQGAAETVFFKW